jgi:hypothetical protein
MKQVSTPPGGLSACQPVSYVECGETLVHLRECQRSTYSLGDFSDRNT